jgi:hypothetical protein
VVPAEGDREVISGEGGDGGRVVSGRQVHAGTLTQSIPDDGGEILRGCPQSPEETSRS